MSRRLAIIGCGAAGLSAAWRLARSGATLDLYEAQGRPGGHAWTVHVPDGPDAGLPLDLGFMIMNEQRYPTLTRLLAALPGVALRPSEMSFSYCCRTTGFGYAINFEHADTAPAVRTAAAHDPCLRRLLVDAIRFGRAAAGDLALGVDSALTLGDYLARRGVDDALRDQYLVPMGAALWSTAPGRLLAFPAERFLRFLDNHGLLAHSDGLRWQHVAGGSARYVAALLAALPDATLLTGVAVDGVTSDGEGVVVHAPGRMRRYDGAVVATHADEALALLGAAGRARGLAAFGYQSNEATLHWDEAVMPTDRRCWAAWNYERTTDDAPPCVSYFLNRLQGHANAARSYFLTLNRRAPVDPAKVILRTTFRHPVFDQGALSAQQAWSKRAGDPRIQCAGSYLGHGFHEDAMASGAAAADALLEMA
jgi:predicted NAD/FAD-binding protein